MPSYGLLSQNIVSPINYGKVKNSDITIAIGLSNSYRNIGLTYLSNFNYCTRYIGLPIVQ
jgi:hypothetical protein